MDTAQQAHAPLQAPVQQTEAKLSIEKFADGPITCLKFSGTIDESFEGKKIARTIECQQLILDLGGVKKISSFGIREWVDFMQAATKQAKSTVLIECAPKVVDQLNMVANFAAGGRVYSFYAPFRCDYCDSEHRVLLDLNKDGEAVKSMKLAERPCPSCKESMYFDEDGTTYFAYMLTQGAFELEPEIINFLSAKLDYRIGEVDAKIRVDKIIDGRTVYLRLSGDLNNTFPRDKLADGLEGTVILDVANIPRVEPAGAAEWRSLIQQVTPIVENIFLIGVQPSFLEKLCTKEDLGTKTLVYDMSLPYTCKKCGTTSSQMINVSEHHSVLKFATGPELKCKECKSPMQCAAAEPVMAIMPGLPKPETAKDLNKKIEELRNKKFEKKMTAAIAPTARPTTDMPAVARSGGMGMQALVALVVVVVAGVGFVAFQKMGKKEGPPPGQLGAVVQRSQPKRPDWIQATATAGVSYCAAGQGKDTVSCVGVSQALGSQEDAEDEASDAAFEALAAQVAGDQKANKFLDAVAPNILDVRATITAAYTRDNSSTQARRDLHDGRHAVAKVVRKVSPPLSGRYWESYDSSEGKKFIAFSQILIPAADVKKIDATYRKESTALGVTAVDFFPLLGWRFGKLDHGAIITKLDAGVLQDIGISQHYIVIAVNGHDVTDAKSFATTAMQEEAVMREKGGLFRLLVQTDQGDPREFSTNFPGKQAAPIIIRSGGGNGGRQLPPINNVWVQYGENRGGGRDNPNE